jgi:hypothetical protein
MPPIMTFSFFKPLSLSSLVSLVSRMLPQVRCRIRRPLGVLLAVSVLAQSPIWAEDVDDLVDMSYIHAAVLGTGTYAIRNLRVTMLKIPLSGTVRAATPDSAGWAWRAPLVLGYDDLSDVKSDIIERLLPDQLVTLSVMPGVEYIYPLSERWQVKPFLELGVGRDFSLKETFALTHLGVRSLTRLDPTPDWQMRIGLALRWAGEYQLDSRVTHGFGIVDLGLDVRRVLPWHAFGERLDVGAYYILERYLPRWTFGDAPDWRGRAVEVHEFGVSVGIPRGPKLLGIELKRFRVGYKKGGKLQGWTFGTEFPF